MNYEFLNLTLNVESTFIHIRFLCLNSALKTLKYMNQMILLGSIFL